MKLFEEPKTKKKKKKNKEKEKNVVSKTYILHDKAGMVKPTFVSELEQYVIFTKNKNFFWAEK